MQTAVASTPIDFPEKLQFLFQPARYKVVYGGRDAAKSWGVARALLILGLNGRERILCGREFQRSMEESVHHLLASQIDKLGMNYLYDVQQAKILGRGSAQGTEVFFEGLRHNTGKIKSYEGITRCWLEEAAKLTKTSFNIITPTVRVPESEIWITFNPELDSDFIYKFFITSEPPPGTVIAKMTWRDNHWLSDVTKAAIAHLRATDLDEYLHVYEGQTRQVLEGSIFADELREVAQREAITSVPFQRGIPVNVYFDLGRSDHTSMWFEQRVGFEHHLIDFYQSRLHHIDHYLRKMQELAYHYGIIWLPHDAKAKTLGTKMSIEEQVKLAGYTVRIVPKLSVADRINAARTVFPQCFFDAKKCEVGIHALRHYQYEVEPPTAKIPRTRYSLNPLHDEHSDAADAFCYFGVASRQRTSARECKIELPRSTMLGKLGELFLGGEGSRPTSTDWLER